MAEITFLLPARRLDALQRTLSMLSLLRGGGFRAVVVDDTGSGAVDAIVPDFEEQFPLSVVTVTPDGDPLWKYCLAAAPEAEWVCFLAPGVDLTEKSVVRMRKCIDGHPSYDAFRWNLAAPARKWRLRTRPDRIFTRVFEDGDDAPLGTFVFRAETLRTVFATDSEAAVSDMAVILAGAKKAGVRTARRVRVNYTAPAPSTDPAEMEKEVRSRLAFFRWSERFFEEEYPLGVGDRLALFAGELAKLYPSYTPEELKDDLATFACVNGPIRRMKASSALKSALKARQESLKQA